MRKHLRALLPALILVVFTGCSNEEPKAQDNSDTSTASTTPSDTGAIHIFTLPAPLQVATMLMLEEEPYNSRHLVTTVPATGFTNNYSRALGMGGYMVDMGYACLYDQRQTALNYAKAVQTLMNDLGLNSSIKMNMVKRFEANIRNNDSLYTIILDSYGQAHNYFQENGREETGLFIMCGSYVEGLYLTLQSKEILTNTKLRNLVGQQKIFLDNIIILCGYMTDKPEVKQLEEMMKEIESGFDGITVKVEESQDGAVAVNSNITYNQLKKLTSKVKEVRKELTAP